MGMPTSTTTAGPAARRGSARREAGAVSLFLALIFVAFLLFAGLIVDGGRVLHANAHASDLAGKAARVGAQEIDPSSIRAGGPTLLDEAAAETAAGNYLATHRLTGHVVASGQRISLTVSWPVRFWLITALRPSATVTQTRSAVPTTGP
jgi:Flp pilus assembly protein TadG